MTDKTFWCEEQVHNNYDACSHRCFRVAVVFDNNGKWHCRQHSVAETEKRAAKLKEAHRRAECFPSMLAALKEALPIIEQDIRDIGPCDHEANLCVCGLKSTVETIRAALAQAEEEA